MNPESIVIKEFNKKTRMLENVRIRILKAERKQERMENLLHSSWRNSSCTCRKGTCLQDDIITEMADGKCNIHKSNNILYLEIKQ